MAFVANRDKPHATQKEEVMTPSGYSDRQSKGYLKPESAATTMNNTLQSHDLKLKLIRPKQTKTAVSRVDSGLKKKRRQQNNKQVNGITYG